MIRAVTITFLRITGSKTSGIDILMKIALISDIHANYVALQTLAPELDAADLVICLGDFVGYYCQVNEVLDSIRQRNLLCVRGNHDDYLVNGCPAGLPGGVRFGIEYADRVIDPDHRKWLAELPVTWSGEVFSGLNALLFHGSPSDPLREYLFDNSETMQELRQFDYDALFFGHSHRFILHAEGRPLILNPGSVGQSREAETKAKASLALLDTETMLAERRLYPFDAQRVIDIARQNDAGDWVYKHLG